ncbi:hypothetical protein [Pelistega suis]|uniref:hypothetical protein n=1 Tax=Pelistega suis TaxID=1631957 RepID=UPI00211C5AE1|nr:hypothetical protein [Pelistega suis]MCQ9327916.1 hypothetical protein [Pelistega suis]
MKLDKIFQDKFFSYLNSLSKEEIINIIEEPTVNVDFLANIISFNNVIDMYEYYSVNNRSNRYFSSALSGNIHCPVTIKTTSSYQDMLDSILNKKESINNNSITEEEYSIAANDDRYALAA